VFLLICVQITENLNDISFGYAYVVYRTNMDFGTAFHYYNSGRQIRILEIL